MWVLTSLSSAVSRTEQVNPTRRGGIMSKLEVLFSFKLFYGSFVCCSCCELKTQEWVDCSGTVGDNYVTYRNIVSKSVRKNMLSTFVELEAKLFTVCNKPLFCCFEPRPRPSTCPPLDT